MKKCIVFPCLLIAVGTGFGCAVDECRDSVIKGNYDRAVTECSKQIKAATTGSDLALLYNCRGLAYSHKKQYELATADFDQTIKLNPRLSGAFSDRGGVHLQSGHLDLAFLDFDEAINLDARNYYAYNNSGYGHFLRGEWDKALADFNRAIELEPKYAVAYRNRGRTYRRTDQIDLSISDFNNAIRINPRYIAAYLDRGAAYQRKCAYQEALLDVDKAIALGPKYYRAIFNRGLLFAAQGQYDIAIADFAKAISLNPKYEYSYLHLLIATWLSKRDPAEATGKLQQLIFSTGTTKWIRIVSKYYLGLEGVNEQNVLQEARKGKDDREVKERLCEAYYYLAVKRLIGGDRSGAVDFFTGSKETSVFHFVEYGASQRMMAQLAENKL